MITHDARAPLEQNPWKLFRNTTAETIPPFSILRITGAENLAAPIGAIRYLVAKPNSTQATAYMVSGPFAVPAGKDGICTTLTQAGYVAYDSGDGTPAVGESWGAQNGEWTAAKDVAGFFICGGVKFTAGVNAVAAIQVSGAPTWHLAIAQFDGSGVVTPAVSGEQTVLNFASVSATDGTSTFEVSSSQLRVKRRVHPAFIVGNIQPQVAYSRNNWSQVTASLQVEFNDSGSWLNLGLGDQLKLAWPDVATLSGTGATYGHFLHLNSGVTLSEGSDLRGLVTINYSGSGPQWSAGGEIAIYYQ